MLCESIYGKILIFSSHVGFTQMSCVSKDIKENFKYSKCILVYKRYILKVEITLIYHPREKIWQNIDIWRPY